jgi:hypothetical protein
VPSPSADSSEGNACAVSEIRQNTPLYEEGNVKMKCDECRELLSWYLESDLQSKEMKEVAEHLSVCKECAEELKLLEEALTLARELHPKLICLEDFGSLDEGVKNEHRTANSIITNSN